MDVIQDLKSRFNIEDTEFEEIKHEVLEVARKLQQKHINFDGHYKIGFYSHMISLVRRLRNGEKVIEIAQEVMSELSQDSIEASEEVLAPLFIKYNVPVNRSEVLLVAIHIQATKYNEERGDEVGG